MLHEVYGFFGENCMDVTVALCFNVLSILMSFLETDGREKNAF